MSLLDLDLVLAFEGVLEKVCEIEGVILIGWTCLKKVLGLEVLMYTKPCMHKLMGVGIIIIAIFLCFSRVDKQQEGRRLEFRMGDQG